MIKQANVILMVVDQMRYEALSLNDRYHFVSTPTLDMMASEGCNFTNAYSSVPTCVPARAALLTGLDQEHSGRVGYEDEVAWNYQQTIAQTFKDAGYQTQCIGKMHVYPARKRLGFDNVLLHDGYLHVNRKYFNSYGTQFEYHSDYLADLKQELGSQADLIDDGMNCNSWQARPFMFDEMLHPTNWVVSESIKFLSRRDPTVPFFLKMSFEKPHAPLDPPKYYFDMYMERLKDIDLHIGNWEKLSEQVPSLYALKGKLKEDDQKRMVAAYLGLVTHIDHQISRFLTAFKEFGLDKNTVIWLVSDHGDQLGEHYLFRKGYPYQGSIHVPSFIYDPGNILDIKRHQVDELIKLQDIYPSLAQMILDKDVKVDGQNIAPLLKKADSNWRDEIHGEHCLGVDSSQFILTKRWKFIWFSVRDEYQLFDLQADPNEQNNLIAETKYQDLIADFKQKMAVYLKDREEGFVEDGVLVKRDVSQVKATLDFAK